MQNYKKTEIDVDHEIEEFLQTYIVQKITSSYDEKLLIIEKGVNELQENIKVLKNTNNIINQDISLLIQNDNEFLGDLEELDEQVKKVVKNIQIILKAQKEIKSLIPNDEKIIEELSNKWTEISDKKFMPIQKDILTCIEDVSELSNVICGITSKVELIPTGMREIQSKFKEIISELNSMNDLFQSEQISITEIINVTKNIECSVSKSSEELRQNDETILQQIHKLNQKINYLWITIGIDSLLILGLLVAFICK